MKRALLRLTCATSLGAPLLLHGLESRRAAQFDALFEQNQFDALQAQLREELAAGGSADADVLWRLARATRFLAKDEARPADERRAYAEEAVALAEQAVAADESNWAAHKWVGIALSTLGDFLGTKEALKNAFAIRAAWDRAFALNPNDATTAHLLGSWCLYFADMSYATYYAAKLIYATPPQSSYEEALQFFERAEELDSGFYLSNAWMLAKVNKKLGRHEEYRRWRDKTLSMEAKDIDDKVALYEARQG